MPPNILQNCWDSSVSIASNKERCVVGRKHDYNYDDDDAADAFDNSYESFEPFSVMIEITHQKYYTTVEVRKFSFSFLHDSFFYATYDKYMNANTSTITYSIDCIDFCSYIMCCGHAR